MKKKTHNQLIHLILYLAILIAAAVVLRILFNLFIHSMPRNLRKRRLRNKSSSKIVYNYDTNILYANKIGPVRNNRYKENIVIKKFKSPNPNAGIRVNYYTSGKSLLM